MQSRVKYNIGSSTRSDNSESTRAEAGVVISFPSSTSMTNIVSVSYTVSLSG